MQVRRASPEEWSALRDLRLRALAADPRAFGARLAEERAEPVEAWRARVFAPRRAAFVVEGWSGMCTAALDGSGDAEIFSMWVAPEARGQGAGAALLEAAMAWARGHGAASASLWVNVEQEPARRLYLRLGFEPTGPPEPGTRDPTRRFQRLARRL